jgi:hypothetical protein
MYYRKVVFVSKEVTQMRNIEKKVWLGLLSIVGLVAPFSNAANALDNNL